MIFIDHSVYPDLADPPGTLDTPEDQADYVHRICAAWDFHVHPEPETFALLSGWKEIFDRFPILTSPAYHAFRTWFGWQPVPIRSDLPCPTPLYVHLDRLEERMQDPCEGMI